MSVRNPWSGQQAEVVNGSTGAVVVAPTTAATLSVPVTAGQTYLVEQPANPTTSLAFAQVTGSPARSYRQLGNVSIGLSGNSVSTGGNTVTVTSPGSQSGAVGTAVSSLQIHATDSAAGQTLTYGADGLPPGLSISSSGLITGTPSSGGNYTALVTATDSTGSTGSTSFGWSISGGGSTGNTGALHAVGAGKCLDDPNSTTTGGTQQQIYSCNGQPNQTWTHTSTGALSVTVGGQSLCLDANNKGTTNGTKAIIWACNGQSNQQWNFNSNGTITGAQSGLCLDVTGASTADGALVELWACNGGGNQQWTLG
ncbi:MAG: ricin-type beta-trefoil lectin domain protein [Actinocrinis sp.]